MRACTYEQRYYQDIPDSFTPYNVPPPDQFPPDSSPFDSDYFIIIFLAVMLLLGDNDAKEEESCKNE